MSVGADAFRPVDACWICGGCELTPYHTLRFDLDVFRNHDQDHELAAYTGASLQLVRCAACGFGQPQALPTLPRYFDRLYDQRHDESWIAGEFDAAYKDLIFTSILRDLDARVRSRGRRLLDVGTHAGRFLQFATRAGWHAEGIELNPRTAAFAATRAGVPVHQANAASLAVQGRLYDAIVLTDVLEHIPAPLEILGTLADMLAPGGVLAVKVPCGSAQALKERTLAALTSHRATLADNLVHVNHFSPQSLARALQRVGLTESVAAAAPELNAPSSFSPRATASNLLRLGLYRLARVPGAVHTPIALHLQAYGVRPIA
jgi:SAM-dependent methyltransferase